MKIDIDLFLEMLNVNSTSSNERELADLLLKRLPVDGCTVTVSPENAPEGLPVNILLSWGKPRIVFCTHLDTVPPYIAPRIETLSDGDTMITGRGACDAKGQIISMYTACRTLQEQGYDGFGLLLLYGEETGSYGAKEYCTHPGAEYVVVGEPTDNAMVDASKGTKSFGVTIYGKNAHSGYPQYGHSAIDTFVDMVNKLRAVDFPFDPVLGETTFNIGKLISDNPQNVLSDRLSCRVYFRTTFASDEMVQRLMEGLHGEQINITAFGGDTPMHYLTLSGFPTTTVAFGSDAPRLSNFPNKMLCGPGSILVAHRKEEHILLSQLQEAVRTYIRIFKSINR